MTWRRFAYGVIPTSKAQHIARVDDYKEQIKGWEQSIKEEKATYNRSKRIKILNDAIKEATYTMKNYQASLTYAKQKKPKMSKSKKYWK